MQDINNEIKYAGYFSRLAAAIIDYSAIFFIFNMFTNIGFNFSFGISTVAIIFIFWLYFAFTVSKWQGTIGNLILGIKIKSADSGKRLSLLHSSIRFFLSIVPFIIYEIIRTYQHSLYPQPSMILQQLPQLIYLLAPMVMFFAPKKQMLHDLAVHSVVINDNTKSNKPINYLRLIIIVVVLLVFGASFARVAIYTATFAMFYHYKQQNYDASFHTKYNTHDYNDTNIIFYKNELEKYQKDFINAQGMYDIFAADTKSELAQSCIEVLVQEHNNSSWIEEGSAFYKNARNKYATSEELIKKAKANEDYLGAHFYDYDMNDVNDIEKKYIDPFDINKSKNICNNKVNIESVYNNKFIPEYIKNREENLKSDEEDIKTAPEYGTLNKSFYKRNIKIDKKLLNQLYDHYPKFLEQKKIREKKEKEFQQKLEKEMQEALLEQKKEKEEAYQKDLKNFSYPIFAMIVHNKNKDLDKLISKGTQNNVKGANGVTPIFAAISYHNIHAIKALLDAGVDTNQVNRYGENLLCWAIDTGASIDIIKTLIEHGVDVNAQHNKSETALTLAAKGCGRFELVKYLLSQGADPNIVDEFGYTTLTGLHRYCRDKKQYRKMKELINDY